MGEIGLRAMSLSPIFLQYYLFICPRFALYTKPAAKRTKISFIMFFPTLKLFTRIISPQNLCNMFFNGRIRTKQSLFLFSFVTQFNVQLHCNFTRNCPVTNCISKSQIMQVQVTVSCYTIIKIYDK